ncbi:MAG: PAS domain S-box protein [Nitrospiraceae bacterium]|nr:MAG: PAS domain S-box protein [Nitrospiraceae bacterium]
MTDTVRFKYKRAFLAFLSILLIFLLVSDLIVVSSLRKQMLDEVHMHVQNELDLIATFVREPLLKHDYAKVEEFLMSWAEEQDEVVEVRAVMPNNFVLADYKGKESSRYVYMLEKQVRYGGRDLMKLQVIKDLSGTEKILAGLRDQLVAFSIFLTVILGTLLWRTFKAMALKPLENEITLRTQAEEKLQKARDQLEVKVKERTAELEESNKSLLSEIQVRERMETDLKESEEKFRAIFDNAIDGILLADIQNKKFMTGNKMICRMLGYSAGEIKGLGVFDIHPEKDLAYVIQQFDRQSKKEITIAGNIPVKRKDGSVFYADISSAPVTLSGVTYLIGIFRDITERRRSEEKLRHSEQYLKTIIENEPECVKVTTPEGVLVTMNPAGLAMIEADSLEQVAGQKVSKLVCPEYHDEYRKFIEGVLRGSKRTLIYKIVGLRGTGRWLETHAVPLRDEDNNITGVLAVTRDITEKRQAEETLRISEEKFSKAFRSSPAFITISTVLDGRFIEVNDAFIEASGYSREEMIGISSLELGIWADASDRREMVILLKDYGVVYNRESRFRMKSGEIINILYSAELINIEGEECIIAVILDITERKKLENQLLQSQKMEAVGQLAGGVAHDFNNIITAIVSYGYILKKRLMEDGPSRDNIDKILLLSDRAAQITRGLLTFSRKQHFEFVPVRLNEIIINIRSILANFIGEDIEVYTKLSDRDIIITADSAQIEQVILNLATNARDAMPEGGRLNIETEPTEITDAFIKAHGFGRPGMYALLSVSDTGTGMDEETRQRVFEPFFTTKEVGKGTGLGLSVVYGIIKQHGGYINIYSEPGKGTTFRIYLPEVKASVEMEVEKRPQQQPLKSATILVAEDEPAVRDSIRNILEEFGYKVIEAVDGQDAIDKFAEHKDEIQLLLLDVVMPKKNGKEAHEEIKRMKPGTKAIFTSGYTADIILRKKVLEEEVIFVSKPIMPDSLLSKIREVIEGEH